MVNGEVELKKVNGAIYIDRNPKVFAHVLDYLYNEMSNVKMD